MRVENIWIALLVAFIGLVRTLIVKGQEAAKRQQQSRPPSSSGENESDTERMRKFLDALGQPPGTTPPPPVRPRTEIPPRPVAPVQPPLVGPTVVPRSWQEEGKRRVVVPKQIAMREGVRDPDDPSTISAAPPRRIPAVPRVVAATRDDRPTADTIRAFAFSSPDALRRAFILREVLGPPRAFAQDFAGDNAA